VFDAPLSLALDDAGMHTRKHVTGQRLALWLQAAGGSRGHAHFRLLARIKSAR
jgi:hypothetical protein